METNKNTGGVISTAAASVKQSAKQVPDLASRGYNSINPIATTAYGNTQQGFNSGAQWVQVQNQTLSPKTKLIIAGTAAAGLLAGYGIYVAHKKKLDREAAAFFSELERNIAPASAGIIQSDAFDIHYWENLGKKLKKPYFLLTQKSADSFAKDIHDAWGFWDDDEDKIYSVYRALKDQVQASMVAYKYYQKNKVNLIDDMRSRLSKDEVGEVMKIVQKLPPYRLGPEPKTTKTK